jgi:hypothetical protein
MREYPRRLVHARLHLDSGATIPAPAYGTPASFSTASERRYSGGPSRVAR